MTVLAVAVGGGIGALVRWIVDTSLPRPSGFPLGITVVNVVGSLVLGFVVGYDIAEGVAWLDPLTVGVLGGFTTYSTWMVDIDAAPTARATILVVGVPLVLGLAAAFAGVIIGASIA